RFSYAHTIARIHDSTKSWKQGHTEIFFTIPGTARAPSPGVSAHHEREQGESKRWWCSSSTCAGSRVCRAQGQGTELNPFCPSGISTARRNDRDEAYSRAPRSIGGQ